MLSKRPGPGSRLNLVFAGARKNGAIIAGISRVDITVDAKYRIIFFMDKHLC